MNTVPNYALPAITVPAIRSVPAAGDRSTAAGRPIEAVPAIAREHGVVDGGSGRWPIRQERPSAPAAPAIQAVGESDLRLVRLAPDTVGPEETAGRGASLWFLAQLYGQSADTHQSAALGGHRDAPEIGTAAYRQADAVSGPYPQRAAVFSFAI